ncbi:MAG: response regulator [Actinomycetota bacterium]
MPRILIIEPEMRARHALRSMLEGAGYEVETAVDGSEGIETHRHKPADLVIADLDDAMDKANAFLGIRMIAVPGGGRDSAEIARKLGAQHFLPKPFRRDALLAAVRNTLGSQPAL